MAPFLVRTGFPDPGRELLVVVAEMPPGDALVRFLDDLRIADFLDQRSGWLRGKVSDERRLLAMHGRLLVNAVR
ncbi:hypothetical protein D3C85_1712190 [compost metagenome]